MNVNVNLKKKVEIKWEELEEEVIKAVKDMEGRQSGQRIIVYMNIETGEIGSSSIMGNTTHINPDFWENHVQLCFVGSWSIYDFDNISAESPEGEEREGYAWNEANEEWESEELLVDVISDEIWGDYFVEEIERRLEVLVEEIERRLEVFEEEVK